MQLNKSDFKSAADLPVLRDILAAIISHVRELDCSVLCLEGMHGIRLTMDVGNFNTLDDEELDPILDADWETMAETSARRLLKIRQQLNTDEAVAVPAFAADMAVARASILSVIGTVSALAVAKKFCYHYDEAERGEDSWCRI